MDEMNELDGYMDDMDVPGAQRWGEGGGCHVERICGQCVPGIQGAVVSEQHTRLESAAKRIFGTRRENVATRDCRRQGFGILDLGSSNFFKL